jgi:hypothetical protein
MKKHRNIPEEAEIPTSGKLNECENISNRPSLEGDFLQY